MAELEINPSQLPEYRLILKEEIATSIATEPGVLMLNAVCQQDMPEKIMIMEVYETRQDYERHLQTPHFLKYKALTAGMIKSLKLIAVEPVCMRSKPAVAELLLDWDDAEGAENELG